MQCMVTPTKHERNAGELVHIREEPDKQVSGQVFLVVKTFRVRRIGIQGGREEGIEWKEVESQRTVPGQV